MNLIKGDCCLLIREERENWGCGSSERATDFLLRLQINGPKLLTHCSFPPSDPDWSPSSFRPVLILGFTPDAGGSKTNQLVPPHPTGPVPTGPPDPNGSDSFCQTSIWCCFTKSCRRWRTFVVLKNGSVLRGFDKHFNDKERIIAATKGGEPSRYRSGSVTRVVQLAVLLPRGWAVTNPWPEWYQNRVISKTQLLW